MLKNKRVGKKIRNIIILLMIIAIMIGAYQNIDRSRAEKLVEVSATALDNYGYLENEELKLEANQIEDNSYEIQIPECVNNKKISQVVKASIDETNLNAVIRNVIIVLVVCAVLMLIYNMSQMSEISESFDNMNESVSDLNEASRGMASKIAATAKDTSKMKQASTLFSVGKHAFNAINKAKSKKSKK